MDTIFLCVIVFLFLLAIFDLWVGVSNDAVNFLNSALGSKAASFKTILIIASVGVFIGAALSNGMMDIARHGIFRPEHFSFYDLVCIFMAVMVTDIILLDIFNSLGMPTSTTVSMVFELLGATFVVALLKMASGGTDLGLGDLLNTEKALSVILGIFLSVAIAFLFGTLVQWLSRLIFTFNYRSTLKWKIGIFGGISITAIIFFMLLKGTKDLTFMTPGVKDYIATHTWQILGITLVVSTLLMQLLYILKVNVLKVIVLVGTFSLAVAFAGNDLVNFIGVPLTGFSSWQDYSANGAGDSAGFLMGSLNGPSSTSTWFLVGAGLIMVVSLATSKKAQKVSQTEIGLGSQDEGEEMFGSSRLARRLVRWVLSALAWVDRVTPPRLRRKVMERFNVDRTIMEQGAAFDLIRASINLVLASVLIAAGTSMKLPLSTTFVTFMVAMGTSLSDRAWSRESAVFRITGVISVIGGWFITAGVAFLGAGLIVLLMHLGGQWVMFALAIVAVVIIIRSNRRFSMKEKEENGDTLFSAILSADSDTPLWPMLKEYITLKQSTFLAFAAQSYTAATTGFANDDLKTLSKTEQALRRHKDVLKSDRRKETLCLRRVPRGLGMEKSAWFHLANNCCMSILYHLRRIAETGREHVSNNFKPLPEPQREQFALLRTRIDTLFNDVLDMLNSEDAVTANYLRHECEVIKNELSSTYHRLYEQIRTGDASSLGVMYVYLNILQETNEMVSTIRKYIRAYAKLLDTGFTGHPSQTAAPAPNFVPES